MNEHDQIISLNCDEWEAGCSCGWDAPGGFPDIDDAIDAWENHCDVVFMEATISKAFEDHHG